MSKRDIVRSSPESLGQTDLAKLDSHAIQPEEYEEIPELTDETMARADHHVGGVLVRRGRPEVKAVKRLVSIRFDDDVLEALRATGPGWQTRLNDAARDWLAGRPARVRPGRAGGPGEA